MMKVEKILMPTDFSDCAQAALAHALFLAEQLEAELHLLHVIVLPQHDPLNPAYYVLDDEELYERLRQSAATAMRQLIDAQKDRRIKIVEALRRGIAAAPEIVAHAEKNAIDLIVLGAHGRRGLRRLLLGSVAEEVVRTTPCPVLTLRGTTRVAAPRDVGKIVVPIDFSPASRQALLAAKELAALYGSQLHLLHVVETPIYPQYYEPLYPAAQEYAFPQLAVSVEEGLARFERETAGPETKCHFQVLEGNAPETIADYAHRSGAYLIVIATHGLRGLERFLLGSVTEKVVRLAECPVLTLKAAPETAAGG